MVGVNFDDRAEPVAARLPFDRRQVGETESREQQSSLESSDRFHAAVDDHGAAVLQVEFNAQPFGVSGQSAAQSGGAGVEIHWRASASKGELIKSESPHHKSKDEENTDRESR